MADTKHLIFFTIAAFVSLFSSMKAVAQTRIDGFPSKPITIVIAGIPGTLADADARFWSQPLTESLGRPVLLEHKPGGGGIVGANYVAKAAPDGHTLFIITGSHTTLAAFRDDLPYDAVRDFSPISLVSKRGVVLVVTPSLPVRTLAEYISYAKANPGKLNWGTNGSGTTFHIVGAWFANATDTDVTMLPYKTNAQMYIDLFAGRVHVSPMTTFTGLQYIKSGKVRPLAQLTMQRSVYYPDLATASELGVADFDYSSWQGFVAPARTPGSIVTKINGVFSSWSKSPTAIKNAATNGAELVVSTPDFLGQTLVREIARWRKVIRDNNIKAEE